MGIDLESHGNTIGTPWEYLGNAMGTIWDTRGRPWEQYVKYFRNTVGIPWRHHRNTLQILWEQYGDTVEILWELDGTYYWECCGNTMGTQWE